MNQDNRYWNAIKEKMPAALAKAGCREDEISAIECLSEGDYPDVGYYNCAPRGVYDELSGDRLVYYQKSEIILMRT